MPKCSGCGQWGLFLRLENGFCIDCVKKQKEELQLAEERRLQEEKKQREYEEQQKVYNSPSAKLDRIKLPRLDWPVMLNGVPKVYHYAFSVICVDRQSLYEAVKNGDYRADLAMTADGKIDVTSNGLRLGRLMSPTTILADWLERGDPILCQFTVLRKGEEHLGISLFRDDESRLSCCESATAKLTAFTTDTRQCNIGCLEPGQKLFVEIDDNDKPYVRDINFRDVGKLPAKYLRMHEEGTLKGMFFDRTEQVENSNGEINDAPFVRFYFE